MSQDIAMDDPALASMHAMPLVSNKIIDLKAKPGAKFDQ
jgi:hypothetical protein